MKFEATLNLILTEFFTFYKSMLLIIAHHIVILLALHEFKRRRLNESQQTDTMNDDLNVLLMEIGVLQQQQTN